MQYRYTTSVLNNGKDLRNSQAEQAAVIRALILKDKARETGRKLENNSQKLNALKEWYPLVYADLREKFLFVCLYPESQADVIINPVNKFLEERLDICDYRQLKLLV